MPKNQTLIRTAQGLYSQFNNLHGIPEGGLLECENFNIDRHGVLSSMRGRNRYGQFAGFPVGAEVRQLLEFQDKLIRHHGTTLDYDSGGGGWTAFAGNFSAPDAEHRIRSFEALLSFFFTTSLGVFKKATLTDEPVRSGIHEGLDINLAKVGTGAGFFSVNTQVAYRIVFGRRDANMKLLLGAPTWAETAVNAKTTGLAFANAAGTITVTHVAHGFTTGDIIEISDSSDLAQVSNGPKTITVTGVDTYTFAATGAGAGGTLSDGKKFNVTVNATIPTDIVAGDFYQVYRTEFSADAATPPGDEMKLVQEVALVAGDITAGVVSFTDTFDAAFLGELLYTNQSLEGIANANARPPWAKDACLWKNHAWFLNTKQPQTKRLTLLSILGLVDNTSSITLTSGVTSRTYTFSTVENQGLNRFQRFTGEPTQAQNVERTAKSLCKIVNRDTGQTLWEARYVSGVDDAPGIIEFRRRTLNTVAITFIADSAGTGDNFSPTLPTAGTTITTTDDAGGNRLYRSKFERVEAVPIGSNDPIGSERYEGLRILPLKDSLIILTERGVYRASGETDGFLGKSFVVGSEVDPSIQVVCPEAAVILNNAVYCLSTQGVIRVDESGTDLVSLQIEDDLKELFGFSNFRTVTFAVAYESDRKYILYRQEISSDTVAKFAHVYNYLTNTWTRRRKTISAAHVLFTEDKLYEAETILFFVLQERKSFVTSGDDYRDEDHPVNVTAVGTIVNSEGNTVSTVTFTYTFIGMAMQSGFLFEQGTEEGIIEEVTDLGGGSFFTVLDVLCNPIVGGATVSLPIPERARWRPEACGNPEVIKQFPEVTVVLEQNRSLRHTIGFLTNIDSAEFQLRPIRTIPLFGWGEGAWGDFGWGDEGEAPSTPLRCPVPRQHQRCEMIGLTYERRRAKERVDIASVGYTFRSYGERTVRGPR